MEKKPFNPGSIKKIYERKQMKNRYRVFILSEACVRSGDYDTLSEAIEHCRQNMFEALFIDEMIIEDTLKDRIVRRFHWEDFNEGGKMFKPPACPKCKSENTIPISYGYPSEKGMRQAEKGKIKLGGCCISDNDPQWYCKSCKKEFGKIK